MPSLTPTRTATERVRPRPVGRIGIREWLTADQIGICALLLIIALIAVDDLRGGRGIYRVDIITQYMPWYTYLGEQLRHGNIPGWMPFSFSGAPFAGDPQSGWMYFPAMAIFTVIGGTAGFKLLILFHMLLVSLSTYWLARLLGMSPFGAVAAGTLAILSGFLERTRCCTIHAEVAAWLPLAFVGIELAARARTRLAQFGWLAVCGLCVSQMLAGWLGQGAYYGILAVGAYTAYRTLLSPPDRPPIIARLLRLAGFGGVILVTGFGLAAAGVLPRLDVVSHTPLANGYEAASKMWSISTLADHLVSRDNRVSRWYAGAAALALAILAPFIAGTRYRVRFWLFYAIGVLLLVFSQLFIWWPLYRVLPRFEGLHQHLPDRILTVFYLAVALLAGAFIDVIATGSPSRRRLAMVALAILAMVPAAAGIEWLSEQRIDWPPLAGVAAAAVLVAVVAWRPNTGRIVAVFLIALMVFMPTGLIALQRISPNASDQTTLRAVANYTNTSGAGAFLRNLEQTEGPFRFYGYDPALLYFSNQQRTYVVQPVSKPYAPAILVNNRAVLLGLQDIQGYNPVQLARYVTYMTAANGTDQSYHAANVMYRGWESPLIDLLNARYLVIPAEIPAGRPDLQHIAERMKTVYADDMVRVVENPDALPRAWIVHDAQTASDEQTLQLLNDGTVDPRTTALLTTDTTIPSLTAPAAGDNGSVQITSYSGDRIQLQVQTGADGIVMLSEQWDPGWRVYVDGQRSELLRADYLLRGVPVTAGTHTIELRYQPASLHNGLLISIGTAAVIVVALVALAVVGRKRFPPIAPDERPSDPWRRIRRREPAPNPG